MSWEPEVIAREFPDAMHAVRMGTGERQRYVPETKADRAETYRRQLGGTNAALNRAKQRVKELEQYAAWYEQEYEPQARERIEELEELCGSLWWQGEHCPEFGSQRCMRDCERRMHELGLLEGVDE